MWPYPLTQELLFEALRVRRSGQFDDLVNSVIQVAGARGVFQVNVRPGTINVDYRIFLVGDDRANVPELIRQLMWRLLVKGIIVFGMNEANPDWPHYRLTGIGDKVIDGQRPQPYDPENFLLEFRTANPTVDPVIDNYLEEAVKAFNSDCLKSSAVMLGAASEKAILILFDLFSSKITDAAKKTRFDRDTESWMVSTKFRGLHDRLILMNNAHKFPRGSDLNDIVVRDMPGFFDMVRRLRNAAGHPELIAPISEETVFLNLRVFTEYIRSIYKLITFFNANDADW